MEDTQDAVALLSRSVKEVGNYVKGNQPVDYTILGKLEIGFASGNALSKGALLDRSGVSMPSGEASIQRSNRRPVR